MRILIFLIVFSKLIFAQYDSLMYNLIKTTYERSFDKHIIYQYLHSNSEQKTKAAILSIAQSEDTSFVPELLKLDIKKYGSEICFALGQIGSCNQSLNFLWKYLYTNPPPEIFPKIFFVIGKIGSEDDLRRLIEFYNSFEYSIFPYDGISNAILQFQIRGIKNEDAKTVLEKEVLNNSSSSSRVSQTLFVLSRYNSSDTLIDKLKVILKDYNSNNSGSIQYALMNFQKLKTFDITDDLLQSLINTKDELLQIELAKSIIYSDYHLKEEKYFKTLIKFLYNPNLNISIPAAISLRDMDETLVKRKEDRLNKILLDIIDDPEKDDVLKSEIFLSGYSLLGNYESFKKLIRHFNPTIKCETEFISLNPNQSEAINDLINYYKENDLKYKIEALNQLIKFLPDKINNFQLREILFDALTSNYAPLISTASDGIDSSFIVDNSKKIKEIISDQLNIFNSKSDFIEATISLINLAEKIDKNFYEFVIEKVKSSKLYSIRKLIASKTGDTKIGFKELDKFDDIWSCAYKYKQAVIKTTKGEITIEFNSDIAPISVANFCLLAEKKFYENIIFHRVVPGFVIQAGDPTATGWGGPGYDIVSEFSDTDFNAGYVGMASAGKDTEGSQFFIMQGNYPHLDSRYSLFGKVIKGMNTVYKISEEDSIITIKLK